MLHSEETVCSLAIPQTQKEGSEKHSQRKTEYGSSSTSTIHRQFAKQKEKIKSISNGTQSKLQTFSIFGTSPSSKGICTFIFIIILSFIVNSHLNCF